MLAAETAVLLVLYARRVKTLVLVAIIVALIAFGAFERDEFSGHFIIRLLDDFGYGASANGTATFADCEAELLFHSDRGDEVHVDRDGSFWMLRISLRIWS